MPYQEGLAPAVHMNALAAVAGDIVVYQGHSAYDFEVTAASTEGLVVGTKYTISEVFKSVGDPMIGLSGQFGTFDYQMFTDFIPMFGFTSTTSLVGGTGGTAGTFALVIPAPGAGGIQATGTFTVVGGVVTATAITTQGSGYPDTNVMLTNSAFIASAGLTGAAVTLVAGQVN